MAHLDPLYDRLEFIEGRRCVASVERGAPTWGAWTIGAVEWMSGAQDVVAAQNPDSTRFLELGTFLISG
jgi:hypothetical protein